MSMRERWTDLSVPKKLGVAAAVGALSIGCVTDAGNVRSSLMDEGHVDRTLSVYTLEDLPLEEGDAPVGSSTTGGNSSAAYQPPHHAGEYYYVAPESRGDGSGTTRENAADWNKTDELRGLGAGDVVNFLTDGDKPYSFTGKDEHSGIVFTVSGSPEAPIIFRGVGEQDTQPACAEFESNRSHPYRPPKSDGDGGAIGGNLFTIAAGANNLAFQNMCPRNIGNVFTVEEAAELINVDDSGEVIVDERRVTDQQLTEVTASRPHPIYVSGFKAENIRRFFDMEKGAHSANILIEDVNVQGHSKNAIRLRGAAYTTIRQVSIDGGGQDGDNFQSGIVMQGDTPETANTHTLISKIRVSNECGTTTDFHQGEGVSEEEFDAELRIEESEFSGMCDAGLDAKGANPVVAHSQFSDSNHFVRKHPGDDDSTLNIYNTSFTNAAANPGKGISSAVWATGKIDIHDSSIHVDKPGTEVIFKSEKGHGKSGQIRVIRTKIDNSFGAPCISKEGGTTIELVDIELIGSVCQEKD